MSDDPTQNLLRHLKALRTERGLPVHDRVLALAGRFEGTDAAGLQRHLSQSGQGLDATTAELVFSMLVQARRDVGLTVARSGAPTPVGADLGPDPVPGGKQRPRPADDAPRPAAPPRVAGDFPTAIDQLRSGDPQPLTVEHGVDGWTLSWEAHPVEGARYAVVLGEDRYPFHPQDGRGLAVTMGNHCGTEDTTSSHAAVFAVLPGEDTSFLHARGRLLRDVDLILLEGQPGGVLVRWVRPPGADSVVVMRSLADGRLPARWDSSLALPVEGDDHFDADVEPGRSYEYRVLAAFREGRGVHHTRGTGGVVEVPAPLVDDIALDARVVARDQYPGVKVRWRTQPQGEVRVFCLAGPLGELQPGTVLPLEEALTLVGPHEVRQRRLVEGEWTQFGWAPLPEALHEGRSVTLVALAGTGRRVVVAGRKVVRWIAAPEAPVFHDRLAFQLLRFTWPAGANAVELIVTPPGGRPEAGQVVNRARDEFDRDGGIVFDPPLDVGGADVLLRGVAGTRDGRITGPAVRAHYPGRTVLRYELPRRRRVQVADERQVVVAVDRPLGDLQLSIVAHPDRLPLTPVEEGARVLFQVSLPAGSLVPGEPRVVGDFKVPRNARLKGFARSGVDDVAVLDPLVAVLPTAPDLRSPGEASSRCPRCLITSPLRAQPFRCQGDCRAQSDNFQQSALGLTDLPIASPVFEVAAPEPAPGAPRQVGPVQRAFCPDCGKPSTLHVCPGCHTDLPAQWENADVLAVQLVGARGTGKTSFLILLGAHLRTVLAEEMSALVHPLNDQGVLLLRQVDEFLATGKLPPSTRSVVTTPALLEPALLQLGHDERGRRRVLALFDSAGEDMEVAASVARYGLSLSRSDGIVMLVDPLQLNAVRAWLDGSIDLPELAGDPERVLATVASEVNARRAGPGAGPAPALAVVVSKFDGLHAVVQVPHSPLRGLLNLGNRAFLDPYFRPGAGYREDDAQRLEQEVRALMHHLRADPVLRAIDQTFPVSRFSAVSALGHHPDVPQLVSSSSSFRVGDPLRWLLARRGWLHATSTPSSLPRRAGS